VKASPASFDHGPNCRCASVEEPIQISGPETCTYSCVCIPVATASGGLSDLRWCCRSGFCRRPVGHHLRCSLTSPSPEPTSATSDLVTVSALSEKTENRRT
jgi:hypothetical protein